MKKQIVSLTKADKERLTVKKQLVGELRLQGALKEVVEYFISLEDDLKRKHPQFDEFAVEEHEIYSYGACCESNCFQVLGVRLENDEEYHKRIELLKKRKKREIDRERKLYVNLKKKFE